MSSDVLVFHQSDFQWYSCTLCRFAWNNKFTVKQALSCSGHLSIHWLFCAEYNLCRSLPLPIVQDRSYSLTIARETKNDPAGLSRRTTIQFLLTFQLSFASFQRFGSLMPSFTLDYLVIGKT